TEHQGGLRETAELGHVDEVLELAQIHGRPVLWAAIVEGLQASARAGPNLRKVPIDQVKTTEISQFRKTVSHCEQRCAVALTHSSSFPNLACRPPAAIHPISLEKP